VTAKFDLSVSLRESGSGLHGFVEYATDLFDRSTIERLAGHYERLLAGIVAAPESRVCDLPLLSDGERRRLVVEWNDTSASYPRDKCLHELFAEQASRTPDAVAAVFEDERLTYQELDRRANRLAHQLRGLGVGPETIVGLCVPRSLEMVVGLLGILKAGGAYLPLDPDYPHERLRYMIEDSRCPVVVTQSSLVPSLPAQAAIVRLDADREAIDRQPATAPATHARPDNLAYATRSISRHGKSGEHWCPAGGS
jgi:non-ribosomal peptide synthetase component F